jgi:hypothetical protein
LQDGTTISLSEPPEGRQTSIELTNEFHTWAGNFQTDVNYRLLVQQKAGTDPRYSYPAENPDPLDSDPERLTEPQRRKAADIEKRLAAR